VFGYKILDPGYSWTSKLLGAVKVFAAWQKDRIGKLRLAADDTEASSWQRASAAVEQLITSLGGGLSRAASAKKLERTAMRKHRDAVVVESFPQVHDIKLAVQRAMAVLHQVYVEHSTSVKLPREAQAAATTAMIGILFYNGFGGRKAEWEVMDRFHVQEQLDAGLDFLVCKWHKTSHIYGSLAKWLAPGTAHACKVYLRLPRDASRQAFLLPAGDDVARADVPHYLRRFAELFVPKKFTSPTVNLFRKWYHTVLVNLARTENGLLEIMKRIDGHSAQVASRHYVLSTPADDARLAKSMVTTMLGEPVPWPENRELTDPAAKKAHVKAMALPVCDQEPAGHGQTSSDVEPEDEDADLELEYVEGLEAFGIKPPLLAIGDADGLGLAPLADVEPASAAEGSGGDGTTDVEHDGATVAGQWQFFDPITGKFTPRPDGIKLVHAPVDEASFGRQQSLSELGITGGGQTVTRPPPPPEMRQLSLDAAFASQPPAKRPKVEHAASSAVEGPALAGRRTRLDPEHKAWIEERHGQEQKARELPKFTVVPKEWFDAAVVEGRAAGKLGCFTTAEGLRSYIRRTMSEAKEADAREKEARKAAKNKEKEAHKDKKDKKAKKETKGKSGPEPGEDID
jgi:hypothetical protein